MNARCLLAACLICSLLPTLSPAQSSESANNPRLAGFSAQSSTQERDWEKKFQDGIVADNLRESMRRSAGRPLRGGRGADQPQAAERRVQTRAAERGTDALAQEIATVHVHGRVLTSGSNIRGN